jgi:hypothetical protein
MRNRIPSLLLAVGLLIVALSPRLLSGGGDFVQGTAMGIGIGIELIGAAMMIRRSRHSRCRRAA